MSIYDKSSLVLIPSGTKTGKVYSQVPTNGDGDFTFTRSSAATRVNADGNIEKETMNLLLQSNDFGTSSWVGAMTETSGQAGYDGTNDAWLIECAANSGYIRQQLSLSGVYTISVYAKAGNVNWMRIGISNTAIGSIYFDLVNGAAYGSSNLIANNVESAGNGWWRCSATFQAINFSGFQFYPADGNNNLGEIGDNIYIQDAQLEQGLVARDYIETTTSAVYGGITDNVPRLDYTDSSCPALLLEPQRTNLMTHSEYFDDWTNIEGNTIIANANQSPEGLQNAYSFIADTTTNYHRISSSYAVTLGETYTSSVFVKANGYNYFIFRIGGINGAYRNAAFDLTDGTTSYLDSEFDSSSIVDYGNGWYRVTATFTATLTGTMTTNIRFQPNDQNNSGIDQFAGNGTNGGYIYGAQVEAGAYPTSYIPTYGSSVSRNRDVTSLTSVADLIGQTEGTIYSEVRFHEGGNASNWLSISSGNPQNWVFIGKDGDDIRGYVRASNSVIFSNQTFQIVDNALAKVAIAYKSNDVVLYINGTQISSTTNSFAFDATLDSIYFGSHDNGATFETRKQNQALVFKTRLSNEELADLTTL